jgi:hypothetical protein
VLRSLGLNQTFKPEEFASGPATWRFARVLPRGVLIFNALQFAQRTPEKVMSDAELNVVDPTPEGAVPGLARLGLVPGQRGGAEA